MLYLFLIFAILARVCLSIMPGVTPTDYAMGQSITLKVNKVSSTHTLLPFDYYSLAYCRPAGGVKAYSESLGEFLRGDRIENSPYAIDMLQQEKCKVLCIRDLSKAQSDKFKEAIRSGYHNNWLIDGLPAISMTDTIELTGFPVGFHDHDDKFGTITKEKNTNYFLYNHVNIVIDFHALGVDENRIVGFFVEPLSIKHEISGTGTGGSGSGNSNGDYNVPTCPGAEYERLSSESVKERHQVQPGQVAFSYGVQWRPSDVKWASRWDIYLDQDKEASSRIQWFAISNSIGIVLFMAFFVGFITYRSISQDIATYNRIPTDEEKAEQRDESGWKLVHADIFRAPQEHPLLFSVLIGTGAQLTVCFTASLCFITLGFLSPVQRGSIMTGMLLLFVCSGTVGGFTSARLYKTFRGRLWQRCTLLTALLFPGICFAVFFFLNILEWLYGSTSAVPIEEILIIVCLWFGVSVPLVFIGAYYGYQKEPLAFPTNTSATARSIPATDIWYHSPYVAPLLSGLLPFLASFVELFFVMSSIWSDRTYFMFGFFLVAFVILVAACMEVAIVSTYLQLCREDYHWWWRSLMTAGSTALYVFLYSIVYFLQLKTTMVVTYLLYFGYMSLISIAVFLICGSLGFFASLYFTFQIYSSIKVD